MQCSEPVLSLQALLDAGKNLSQAQIDRIQFRDGLFDNAILINLPKEEHRLHDALRTLDKIDVYAERFKAFDGKELRAGNILNKKFFTRFSEFRDGELGCLFSHLVAIYAASTHPNQDLYTIIFEDDIITSASADSYRQTLDSLATVINEETIHLIYLGKCLESCTQMGRIMDNIYRAVSPSCTHAYAIKNSFATRIVEDFQNCCLYPNSATNCNFFNQPIDQIYSNYLSYGIARAVVIHPGIFYQDVLRKASSIKGNHLMAYQECGDLNTIMIPTEQILANQNRKASSNLNYKSVIVIILLILILIYVLGKTRYRHRFAGRRGAIFFFAVFVGALLAYIFYRRSQFTYSGLKKLTLNTFLQYSQRGRRNFPINSSVIPSRKHDFFNPNGILWTNSTGQSIFLTSTRSFDGTSSYPLLQIYDPYLNGRDNFQLLYSKILWLSSDRSIKSKDCLGYEDMRIFSYKGDIYLIGVNLDRSDTGTPSMILVKLDEAYNHIKTWQLIYPPISKYPNKNWAPIVLNDGELGFVVDLDPVLIVKRIYEDHEYQEECEVVYQGSERVMQPTIRNSSITVGWQDVPECFKPAFNTIAMMKGGYRRFIMMGHSKYIWVNILKREVLYQHYFCIIDLPPNPHDPVEVHFSGPLHVEENYSPHIEYISGLCFLQTSPGNEDSWTLAIMYGLRDTESSYITLNPKELERLLSENTLEEMPLIPSNH